MVGHVPHYEAILHVLSHIWGHHPHKTNKMITFGVL